jgi:hypothetical protein
MPILIPTVGEIQRMDHRQRAALAKRLPVDPQGSRRHSRPAQR